MNILKSGHIRSYRLLLWAKSALQALTVGASALQKPEVSFLTGATIFGIFMALLMPPLRIPDEASHFYRSYQISEGHIFSANYNGKTGGFLPSNVINMDGVATGTNLTHHYSPRAILQSLNKTNGNKRDFVAFNNTAVYSPLSYVPQTIAILVGKLFFMSATAMLYLGRLLNLLIYVVLIYLSIRIIPFGKWALVVIGLIPMSIQQAASLSGDVTVLCLAFVSVAVFLHILYSNKLILSRKHWVIVIALGIFLGLTKQTDAIFILPFLFLPTKFFHSLKQRLLFIGTLVVCTLGSALVWYIAVKAQHYDMDFAYIAGKTADQAAQTHFILLHPLTYLHIVARTFIYNTVPGFPTPDFYWISMMGYFSWFSYSLPIINLIIAYFILFAALLIEYPRQILSKITPIIRLSFIMTFLGLILGIATIIYLVGNIVGVAVIRNLQGRYFLPALPLLIPVFANNSLKLTFSRDSIKALLFTGLSTGNLIMALFMTWRYFYA